MQPEKMHSQGLTNFLLRVPWKQCSHQLGGKSCQWRSKAFSRWGLEGGLRLSGVCREGDIMLPATSCFSLSLPGHHEVKTLASLCASCSEVLLCHRPKRSRPMMSYNKSFFLWLLQVIYCGNRTLSNTESKGTLEPCVWYVWQSSTENH